MIPLNTDVDVMKCVFKKFKIFCTVFGSFLAVSSLIQSLNQRIHVTAR